MLLATWNVNSIRAREERLLRWLERRQPDVLCLQELKVADAAFPREMLQFAGYHAAVHGQKTWHGVAILSRTPPVDIERGLADGIDDPQARLIAATVAGIRVVSVYVPNGRTVGSDSYEYKLRWLERLRKYVRREMARGPLVVCGDFNIAPEAADVARPERWEGTVLFNAEMRAEFGKILACGLEDVVARRLTGATRFSWWDYRLLSFPHDDGLRIDHILASPDLAGQCREAWTDREERKGKLPSDHAPVLADFGSMKL